jgi:DNA invertase Pin-like site-specific DNA recombinase
METIPERTETQPRLFGYVRVSTREQHTDRQIAALKEFGVTEDCIYSDKQSGKDFARSQYLKMLEEAQPGDTLIIKSIDRLGRDYQETLEQWRIITKEKKCAIVVLDLPLLDTRERSKRDLTGTFIADLVLQILSYVAETERAFIIQRQREGIAIAMAKGVRFGRPPFERTVMYKELRSSWENREVTAKEAANCLGIHYKTFLRWIHEPT